MIITSLQDFNKRQLEIVVSLVLSKNKRHGYTECDSPVLDVYLNDEEDESNLLIESCEYESYYCWCVIELTELGSKVLTKWVNNYLLNQRLQKEEKWWKKVQSRRYLK